MRRSGCRGGFPPDARMRPALIRKRHDPSEASFRRVSGSALNSWSVRCAPVHDRRMSAVTVGSMALLHEATISPRKDELVGPWLRTRPWWDGETERAPVDSFRLDDPAGEVGMECFLFGSASGSTLFVPVTYRDAPLQGREASLLGTMEHSVLGTRYVYDACADPVFVATVLDTIRCGGRQADLLLMRADGTEVDRETQRDRQGRRRVDRAPSRPRACRCSPTDESDRTTIAGPGFDDHCHAPARRSPARSGADRQLRGRQ